MSEQSAEHKNGISSSIPWTVRSLRDLRFCGLDEQRVRVKVSGRQLALFVSPALADAAGIKQGTRIDFLRDMAGQYLILKPGQTGPRARLNTSGTATVGKYLPDIAIKNLLGDNRECVFTPTILRQDGDTYILVPNLAPPTASITDQPMPVEAITTEADASPSIAALGTTESNGDAVHADAVEPVSSSGSS